MHSTVRTGRGKGGARPGRPGARVLPLRKCQRWPKKIVKKFLSYFFLSNFAISRFPYFGILEFSSVGMARQKPPFFSSLLQKSIGDGDRRTVTGIR
jgi:hypothetical protein